MHPFGNRHPRTEELGLLTVSKVTAFVEFPQQTLDLDNTIVSILIPGSEAALEGFNRFGCIGGRELDKNVAIVCLYLG